MRKGTAGQARGHGKKGTPSGRGHEQQEGTIMGGSHRVGSGVG